MESGGILASAIAPVRERSWWQSHNRFLDRELFLFELERRYKIDGMLSRRGQLSAFAA